MQESLVLWYKTFNPSEGVGTVQGTKLNWFSQGRGCPISMVLLFAMNVFSRMKAAKD